MISYVSPSVCLSILPNIQNNLLVWMLGFISILVLGGRDMDWYQDLCYLFLGWGVGVGGILF